MIDALAFRREIAVIQPGRVGSGARGCGPRADVASAILRARSAMVPALILSERTAGHVEQPDRAKRVNGRTHPAVGDWLAAVASWPASGWQPLPGATVIEPDAIPRPHRELLVHDRAMTPTLTSFHRCPLRLDILQRDLRGDVLDRVVLLRRQLDSAPVVFGCISIALAALPRAIQAPIVSGEAPFGQLLLDFDVPFCSRPSVYFSTSAHSPLDDLLRARPGETLWGRSNRLCTPDGVLFARVIEVLPPI